MSRLGKFFSRLFHRRHHHRSGGALDSGNPTITVPTPIPGQLQFSSAVYDVIDGSGVITFQVGLQRVNGKDGIITCQLGSIDGTAVLGVDYQLVFTNVSFGNQIDGTAYFKVSILPRALAGDQTFTLTLANITGGATLGSTPSVVVTIIRRGFGEADFSGATWGVQTPAVSGSITLDVQRNLATKGAVGCSWHTTDGTAIAGLDYTASSGTLAWADGDATFKALTIPILHRPANPNRSFTVTIDTPTGGIAIGAVNIATVTISDIAPGPNPTVTASIANQIVDDFESDESEQLIGDDAVYFQNNITLNAFMSTINLTRLNAIFAVDANNVYAVGNGGLVLFTSNGGTSWATIPTGVTANLFGAFFVSATTGWVIGQNGTILFTNNGGATWTAQTSGTAQQLNGISMASATTGWIVGNGGTILFTNNGGTTWTAQTSGTFMNLTGVSAPSSTTAYAVGQGGTILATTNGGTTWTPQTSGTTQNLNSVSFVSTTTGWAVGMNGTILKTTNGGTTWTAQASGVFQSLWSVSMVSTTTGWTVGSNGTILTTTNGGAAWTAQTSGTTQNLIGVSAVSASNAFIVGTSTVLKTTNGGAAWTTSTSITSISGVTGGSTFGGGGGDLQIIVDSFSPQKVNRFQGQHS